MSAHAMRWCMCAYVQAARVSGAALCVPRGAAYEDRLGGGRAVLLAARCAQALWTEPAA